MVQLIERGTDVLVKYRHTRLTPLFEPPPGVIVPRLRRKESLSADNIRTGFRYQTIAFAGEVGNPWDIAQNISPYNGDAETEVHVVVIDTTDRHMPDLHRVPFEEGVLVAKNIGKVVEFMEQELPSKSVHVGINAGPNALGEEEEKGGYQSVGEMHWQLWNYTTDPQLISLTEVSEGARRAIAGDKYKRLAANYILGPLLMEYGEVFVDPKNIRFDERGVAAKLNASKLSELLSNPEFFAFLQAFDGACDGVARALFEATTTTNFQEMDNAMKYSFENGTDGIYPMLQEAPMLRPLYERTQNIEGLRERGYPAEFVDRLQIINRALRNRDQVGKESWIRKGLAYAMTLSEDLETGEVEIRVAAGIFVGDRGGPVENMGTAILREEGKTATPEETAQRLHNLNRLKEYLASTVTAE